MKFIAIRIFSTLVLILSWSSAHAQNQMNLRVNPLGLLLGGIDATLDFKYDENWTIGPKLSYMSFEASRSGSFTEDFSIKGYSLGARANWFKNGVYTDGLYVGPDLSYSYVKVSSSDTSGTVTAEGQGLYATGLVGYGWFWQNFNMMLGGGLTAGLLGTQVKVKDSNGNETKVSVRSGGLALEWTVGWTF